MIEKRFRDDRGKTKTGWLDSQHSFSFGHYMDPDNMGFRTLRVINEDRVIEGAGFGMHSHSNMEIISYVLKGSLSHKDSLGNGSSITHGDVQLMSAGTGISHSEFNGSNDNEVHFLQIWIIPNEKDTTPDYQEKSFSEKLDGEFHLVVSPDGEGNSLKIKQDTKLYIGRFKEEYEVSQKLDKDRYYWVQVANGLATVNGHEARAGDGFAIHEEERLEITTQTESEVLLFDLA